MQTLLESLSDLLAGMWVWVFGSLDAMVAGLIAGALGGLAGIVPAGLGTATAELVAFGPVVNAWVPLYYAGVLLSSWLFIRVSVLVVRHIIKLVPFIG